jgi:hypothetical protein
VEHGIIEASGASAVGIQQVAKLINYDASKITAATAKLSPNYWISDLGFSAQPEAGMPLTVNWEFTDVYHTNPVIAATLAVSYDKGMTWTNLYSGADKSFTFDVSDTALTIHVRITDAATWNLVSDNEYSVITTDYPAVISGQNQDIGNFAAIAPAYAYSFVKNPLDTNLWTQATVVERIDNVQTKQFTGTVSTQYTMGFSASAWKRILNGQHQLRVDVTNPVGATSRRYITFTKAEDRIIFGGAFPEETLRRASIITAHTEASIPAGASIQVEVCNNGYDAFPAWEDMTAAYLSETEHTFANTEKTSEFWAVNARFTILRGTAAATQDVNIEAASVNWELEEEA